MSIVKDMSLAESGRRKIDWVRSFMPALGGIEERFQAEQPFRGKRIAVSVHLEAKTANLAFVLQKGGAEVFLTGSNPLSTQDDVAAGAASLGIETFGIHGVDSAGYTELLKETLKCRPHIIIDDGGDLVDLLAGECGEYASELWGGCEETTTGILRLKAREKAGALPCGMVAVNDAKSKHYYDNKYGTGQSVWDGIMHTTNLIVAGKTVVVAGYGWGGKGVAMGGGGGGGGGGLRRGRPGGRPPGQGHGGRRDRHGGGSLQGPGRHHERLPGHDHGRGRPPGGRVRHRHRLPGRDHPPAFRRDEE